MAKSVFINIQIDNVDLKSIANIEEKIQEALKEYRRKQVNYSISDTFGVPLPPTSEE